MHIVKISPEIKTPKRGTPGAMAYDVFMPADGTIYNREVTEIKLGFHLVVPKGWGALMFPRSGMGAKFGVELNNTAGLIDHDFQGEWRAYIRLKQLEELSWKKGDRLLQFVVVPCLQLEIIELDSVDQFPQSERDAAGFGSTGR